MIALIIFIVSGSLIALMFIIQAIRLRSSNELQITPEEHSAREIFSDWKTFFLSINRDSMSVFFKVVYRLILLSFSYVLQSLQDLIASFLAKMQGREIREQQGSASFYLKSVSMHKERLQSVEKKTTQKRARRIEEGSQM